jgi:serine-type D-Ala-D-Ala carboxypeptidase/endopeptidase
MTSRREFGALALGGLATLSGCASAPAKVQGPAKAMPSNAEVRGLLAERMARNGMGAVVGVIDRNGPRVVAHGRIGATDARAPNGDTVFQIGSLTKPFTTLLLSDMVVRGEVKLDDPASAYLPSGVRMPQRGRPITLRDLAEHMSGLPSMPTNYVVGARPHPYEAYTVDQLYAFLSAYTPENEPGEVYRYSNLGVSLLGRLLAIRAGADYEPLLKARVLKPLGLASTSITLDASQTRRLAPGHDRYLQPVRTPEMVSLQASGSLRSTANDMLRLLQAYLGYRNTPLEEAMNVQLREGRPQNGRTRGLSWGGATGVANHEGGKDGYRCGVAFDRANGVGAVVLTNARTDDGPLAIAAHLVAGRALEPAPDAPPQKPRVKVPEDVLQRYAGAYRAANGQVFETAPTSEGLIVHRVGSGMASFIASGPNDFFFTSGEVDLSFELGADGRATGLIVYEGGKSAGKSDLAPRI